MRVLLFLLLAIAAGAAFAADPRIVTVPDQAPPQAPAPPPAPKPSQPVIPGMGQPPEAQPVAGQSGTEQSPWFVRVLPTPKTAGEAEAESREADAKAANERGLTKYTHYLWRATAVLAFVAAVQAGLFVWQLLLIRRSLAEAKTSSEAARIGAIGTLETVKALRNAERPYLSPFNPELRNFDKAVHENDWSKIIEVHLDITNVGKGVGFIHSYAIAHQICSRDQQGAIAPSVRKDIPRLPLGPDSEWRPDAPFDVFQISDADREELLDGKRILYVYGYVRYFDLFRVWRRTGFMFQYNADRNAPEKGVFVMCAHPMWYDEEEPESEGPAAGGSVNPSNAPTELGTRPSNAASIGAS